MENAYIRCNSCFQIKGDSEICPHCGCDGTTRNAPHQLPIGTVLKEQYQIGRALGQGGFGITYHGWDLYLDIPVAIKEYYPSGMVMRESAATLSVYDVSGDDGQRFQNSRERFMREAKLLARFSNVHEVVQVKNFFLTNNTAYIVMEYVEGITLTEYVQKAGGKLTAKQTFEIFGPIIQTMSRVHKIGIIHRDIKPNNIMMVTGGAKVLDFGAGRDVSGTMLGTDASKTTEAIVTHGYAAFEQYQRRGLGSWTDVYALCATMYYCMTGEIPPDSPGRLMGDEVLDLDKIPGLTQTQKAALNHGMELRPDRRTATMEQLYEELFKPEPVAPEPVVPEPVKPEPVVPEPVKPEPVVPEPVKPEPVIQETVISQVAVSQTMISEKVAPKPAKQDTVSSVPQEQNLDDPEKARDLRRKKWDSLFSKLIMGIVVVMLLALVGALIYGLSGANPIKKEAVQSNIVSGSSGPSGKWELNLDTGVMVISGSDMYDFCLDPKEENVGERKFVRPWEEYKDQIRVVDIGVTVLNIGEAAFAHCVNLEEVNFGSRVKRIGGDAFWNTAISDLNLPDSLNIIEWCAFEGIPAREVTIPESVSYIGPGAFGNSPNLLRVNISEHTRLSYDDIWLGSRVFSRSDGNMEIITLCGPSGGLAEDYANIVGMSFESNGQSVAYEREGDFWDYPGNVEGSWHYDQQTDFLKISGEMPTDMVGQWEVDNNSVSGERKNVPGIPWASFAEHIRVISVEEGVTRLSPNAFGWCSNLEDIYLPNSLKEIGVQAFLDTGLQKIYIPDSVVSIGEFAFNWSRYLKTVRLPMSLEQLKIGVFSMATELEEIYMGNLTEMVIEKDADQMITAFTSFLDEGIRQEIPENLTIYTPQMQHNGNNSPIKDFCWRFGIDYQEGVYGHKNAQAFGDCAFGLSSVSWALEDNVLSLSGSGEIPPFGSDAKWAVDTEAPWYRYRDQIVGVEIAAGITSLNEGALLDMPNLQWVWMHSPVKLGTGAIDNCGMEELTLPESVSYIEEGAIRNCENLLHLWVFNGTKKIENNAFSGCRNLKNLHFLNGGEALDVKGNLFGDDSPENLAIWGNRGSAAEHYARFNNHTFLMIGW